MIFVFFSGKVKVDFFVFRGLTFDLFSSSFIFLCYRKANSTIDKQNC